MSTIYTDAVAKVEQDLDLEEEDFIQTTEMLGYFNEALREAAAEISTIYEDYFLTSAALPLVLNQAIYNIPSGIFFDKIRGIVYFSGTIIYEIKRIRTDHKFLDRASLIYDDPTDYYRYILINGATNGVQLELSPPSKETSSTNVYVWFLREVTPIVNGTDIVDKDIRFINFTYAYVKGRCKQKENAGVMPDDARAEIEFQRKLMIETLSNRVPDDDNKNLLDMSFYREMS